MPIAICIKCGKPSIDSFHCFSEWCQCIPFEEQIKRYEEKGWKINEDQLKLMRGEKIDIDLVENYVDWDVTYHKMKDNFNKFMKENGI